MVESKYKLWCERATKDKDLISELLSIKDDKDAINEAFYKDLEFGTAGLRGIIGAGTNKLNVYTVGKATQGLAAYVNSITKNGRVAISYDSRIKSDVFARVVAEVFAANGIKVYIFKQLSPVPMLSFAIRSLKCDAGVMITASHNPSKYNGYKAYNSTGCQLGPDAAEYVLKIMNSVDIFDGVKRIDFDEALKSGIIEYIDKSVEDAFLDAVQEARVEKDIDLSKLKVIYTPLNGSGNIPVRKILSAIGATDVTVVKEQELPDGNFPTAPYPNPEIEAAFTLAIKLAKTVKPDLLLATDPDCDRVGIAVKDGDGFRLMTGNEVGILLLNYVLSRRKAANTLPKNPVAVKTVVSSELCNVIADAYGCEIKNVLTGFKFIGEQITLLENKGEDNRFVFGYEESYGYLIGTHARDKDGVGASMMICEMAAYYKSLGLTLVEQLENIYKEYGYFLSVQKSFVSEGQAGLKKIADTMSDIRENPPVEFAGIKVLSIKDYLSSLSIEIESGKEEKINLPKSNVLAYYLTDGSSVIVRPSGTEPKIKLYINAVGTDAKSADEKRNMLENAAEKLLNFG